MPEKIKSQLKGRLKAALYLHSLSTAEFAAKLARKHHLNEEQAYLAGLLHDNAKHLTLEQMQQCAMGTGFEFDAIELSTPALLHAPLGAILASAEFGISTESILQAIRNHTTGHPQMSHLDMVVFLADTLEPMREFSGIEKLRQMAYQDLEHCLLLVINHTLVFLTKRRKVVHPRTNALHQTLISKQRKAI